MDELLNTDQASALLCVPRGTLAYWRHVGGIGPRSAKFGRRVVYRRADLEAWMNEQFAASDARDAVG